MEKLIPDIDGPIYGIPFKIVGFQAKTVKGKYTDLIEVSPKEEITLRNYKEYRNWKEKLSKLICYSFNLTLCNKWDSIVSFKVKYFCDPESHYI